MTNQLYKLKYDIYHIILNIFVYSYLLYHFENYRVKMYLYILILLRPNKLGLFFI